MKKLGGIGMTALVTGLSAFCAQRGAAADGVRVWIGTYTTRGSEGIYALTMNPATGELSPPALAAKSDNPSFLALSPDRKHLYAVGEIGRFEGKPGGAVAAFSVDAPGGKLTELNREGTGGAAPCHLAVDPSGRCVVVANYSDGNAAVFPIADGGRLAPMSHLAKHEGSGPNEKRQKSPHAHGVTFAPAGDRVFIPDLGIDTVKAYRLDAAKGTLTPDEAATAKTEPGAGPRHFAFHPALPCAYSIDELTSTVTQFAWDEKAGTLRRIASVSTLPAGFTGNNSCAEIVIHPNGQFLYGSNRGHDSIAVFALDAKTGAATPVQHVSSGGRAPRCFNLDPSGRFLLAANQETDNLIVLKVDPETGRLSDTGFSVRIPAPVCVLFQ